jgi:hypothetical protein
VADAGERRNLSVMDRTREALSAERRVIGWARFGRSAPWPAAAVSPDIANALTSEGFRCLPPDNRPPSRLGLFGSDGSFASANIARRTYSKAIPPIRSRATRPKRSPPCISGAVVPVGDRTPPLVAGSAAAPNDSITWAALCFRLDGIRAAAPAVISFRILLPVLGIIPAST